MGYCNNVIHHFFDQLVIFEQFCRRHHTLDSYDAQLIFTRAEFGAKMRRRHLYYVSLETGWVT